MSSRQPQTPVNQRRDWETFWGNVWYNLFHALGIIIVIGFCAAIAWSIFAPSAPSPPRAASSPPPPPKSRIHDTANREAMQVLFNLGLMATAKPCAVKNKNVSDLLLCSMFGLRLGMDLGQAKRIMDGSGYFEHEATLVSECPSKNDVVCPGNIFRNGAGFTLSVNFSPNTTEDKTDLTISQIMLIFGPTPYQDVAAMRALFAKIIGPPDTVSNETNTWGGSDTKGGAVMRAYPHSGRYWIVLSRAK